MLPDGAEIFQAYLKSEFSDENIEFWRVCEDYKKIKSSFRMSYRAKMIFKRYIQAEAVREVSGHHHSQSPSYFWSLSTCNHFSLRLQINIDHKTRDVIRRNIKTPTTVCFDDAQRIVYSLMEKDSYPRFLVSDFYRALLRSMSEPVKT